MEYYDPIDRTSWRIAAAVTVAVMVVVGICMGIIRFTIDRGKEHEPSLDIIFEEMLEEPKPEVVRQQSAPTDQRRDKAAAHVEESTVESSNETVGEAEVTETVNPMALFPSVSGNATTEVPEGNRLAPDGKQEQNKGDGSGYNLQGSDQLDAGLQGRGLREGLPKPRTNYKTSRTVVVDVTIDKDGNVTSAKVNLQGTTTTDSQLHTLAQEAALKAKFRASERLVQSGTITYVFKLQ
jgi:TonB family protein